MRAASPNAVGVGMERDAGGSGVVAAVLKKYPRAARWFSPDRRFARGFFRISNEGEVRSKKTPLESTAEA